LFHDTSALFGFCIILTLISQIVSGIMLAFSFIPESMITASSRDEEDIDDLYIDDFFWIHERGVDFLFVFSYFHMLKKLYSAIYEYENEITWKSGVFTFLIFQVVVFAGLVLCCTHLSEITLTIAANIMHTFTLFYGKIYWWIFTDQQLNTDTLLRLTYLHYLSAFFMFYLGIIHSFDMHYDWKSEHCYEGIELELIWWDEALSNEISSIINIIIIIIIIIIYLYVEPETLSYEIFMWGDIGIITDIRYYGVAPHWYFRPFMAWLLVCPHHKTGIFGLLFLFWVLYNQPTIIGLTDTIFF